MAYIPVGLEHTTRGELPSGISSLQELEYLVRDQKSAFLYSTVAMLTLVVYDYIITFNLEVKYIWGSKDRITVTNLLFVLNRYYPIIRAACYTVFSLHPPQSDVLCGNWTDYNSWSTMVNIAIVEILILSRTWALYGRSRLIAILLLFFWLCAFVTVVTTVKSSISYVPLVIPLAPMAVLPCDRPSPYKYMIVYCAALLLELISFLFMMGRIVYLIVKSKAHSRNRAIKGSSAQNRSLALPLIRGIQWHGASYFLVVIFVMGLTVYSSFNARLARAVVNAGVAPTITSIACNRVYFALRGLYFDVTARNGEGISRTAASSPHPQSFFSGLPAKMCPISAWKAREAAKLEGSQRETITKYEYDNEIAVTRQDLETRDFGSAADYRIHLRNRDEERGGAVERADADGEVQNAMRSRRVAFPYARTGTAFETGFHSHGTSSSTVLTSEDSAAHGGALTGGEEDAARVVSNYARGHHRPREMSKSSFQFLGGPGSASSHVAPGGSIVSRATTAVGTSDVGPVKRSLSSLSGVIRPPTQEENRTGLQVPMGDTIASTAVRPHGISERLGSLLRIKKDGKDTMGTGSQDRVGSRRSASEDGPREQGRSKDREREREKHPLDHHYEMETIHSELMHDQASSVWEVGDTELEALQDGRTRGNATWTGVGGLVLLDEDKPDHELAQGLFYREPN